MESAAALSEALRDRYALERELGAGDGDRFLAGT